MTSSTDSLANFEMRNPVRLDQVLGSALLDAKELGNRSGSVEQVRLRFLRWRSEWRLNRVFFDIDERPRELSSKGDDLELLKSLVDF
jgi:hypothetical protein